MHSWPRRIYWEAVPWSFTASSQGRVCVRSASGFLRYLSAIVEDHFLIWAKCERNESASTVVCRTWQRKSAPIRRFRLCQPYVIFPGFFPCRHHAMSKTIRTVGSQVAWDRTTSGTWRPCWHVTFWRFRFVNITGRQIQVAEICRNGCVFDSRWDIVKFCPAKSGVPVWKILSLRDENFCNAGCHCQCSIFMHLLHPNPTPNSICLEPSWRHVNQTSSPCYWTCRHRCGQFHSRRTGCGNILAQLFEIVQMVNGHRREQNKSNCGNWTGRFSTLRDDYII